MAQAAACVIGAGTVEKGEALGREPVGAAKSSCERWPPCQPWLGIGAIVQADRVAEEPEQDEDETIRAFLVARQVQTERRDPPPVVVAVIGEPTLVERAWRASTSASKRSITRVDPPAHRARAGVRDGGVRERQRTANSRRPQKLLVAPLQAERVWLIQRVARQVDPLLMDLL